MKWSRKRYKDRVRRSVRRRISDNVGKDKKIFWEEVERIRDDKI